MRIPVRPALTATSALGLVILATAPARAQQQDAVAGRAMIETSGGASVRSYAMDWLVSPLSELELGASLRFLTAPESPFGDEDEELRFTDVGLFRAGARWSFARRFELAGGLDLLAKQPSVLDEPVLQGGDLGLRFGLAEDWALWARGAGGPLLSDLGGWGEVAAGVQARTSLHETIRAQASLGGAATRLFMGEDSGRPWFTEVAGHGELLMRTPRGEMAGWLGVDYRVPVVHGDGNLEIDPQVRLSFHTGLMLGYVGNWDLFTMLTFVDRGDLEDPATIVPVLDGGFDQTQIIFGAARHIDLMADKEKEDLILQMARERDPDRY